MMIMFHSPTIFTTEVPHEVTRVILSPSRQDKDTKSLYLTVLLHNLDVTGLFMLQLANKTNDRKYAC
jgi:hypothetical protein